MDEKRTRLHQLQADLKKGHTEIKTLSATAKTADEFKAITDKQTALAPIKAEIETLTAVINAEDEAVKALAGGDTSRPPFEGSPTKGEFDRIEIPVRYNLKHIKVGTAQQNELCAVRFREFVRAVCFGNQKSTQWCAEHGVKIQPYQDSDATKVTGAISGGTNVAGGILIPDEFDAAIIRLVETYGVFRQNVRIKPMARDTKTVGRRTAGLTTYWLAPGTTITRSRPSYDGVGLVAKKLCALVAIDNEIAVDGDAAIDLVDELMFEFGQAFALAEDQAGFNGDASATYGGITGVRAKILGLSATRANIAGLVVAADNVWSGIVLSDFNKVVGKLPQYADVTTDAAWYCHRTFYATVMQRLELAAGGVTANEIAQGDRRPRPLFMGYPVNFAQVMPAAEANDQVCALLGNLSLAATLGNRREMALFQDPYSLAADDQTQWRATERLDIVVHDVGNADSTASLQVPGPIVGLLTAAS